MPLIDGKFEIIRERPLGPDQTLIDATAPDGAAVSIVWYEVGPEREASFEHYRRTLKRLKRVDMAAVYDVVSRPGAHYVAWVPADGARPTEADRELTELLNAAGFRPEDADIRRVDGRAYVYGLAFDGTTLPSRETVAGDERPAPRPKGIEPPAWSVTAVASAILLGLALLFLFAGLNSRSNDRLIEVPVVIGTDVNEAARLLANSGLAVDVVPVASQEAAGTVVGVEPSVGNRLRPGRTVRLSYALPSGTVAPAQVPRVVARAYPGDVEATLTTAGLVLGEVAQIPADQAAGLVISQVPAAGQTVGTGSSVDILVSAGPADQLTFLPDLTGLAIEDARYLARIAGLPPDRILEDYAPAAGMSTGTVVGQSLRPFQPVAREDATLRLIVAGRPESTLADGGLPSFVGMELDEARELAGALDVRIRELSTRQLPAGVVDQEPPVGTEGATEVTLVVNLHPVPIPRPEVTARVREPEPRELPYRWFIEPGIPTQTARVTAQTLEGDTFLVVQRQVSGGDMLAGEWRTSYPGPVTFSLTLNGEPYGGEQLVR